MWWVLYSAIISLWPIEIYQLNLITKQYYWFIQLTKNVLCGNPTNTLHFVLFFVCFLLLPVCIFNLNELTNNCLFSLLIKGMWDTHRASMTQDGIWALLSLAWNVWTLISNIGAWSLWELQQVHTISWSFGEKLNGQDKTSTYIKWSHFGGKGTLFFTYL